MNLSHNEPLDPEMDHGKRKKRMATPGETLPTDDHASRRFLKLGAGALGLKTRDVPHEDLRADAAVAAWLTEVLRLGALIGDEDVRPVPGASTAWHSSRPMAARAGHHTRGSR